MGGFYIQIFTSPNSYHYSLALPPFSTISLHFYPSTSSIVENVENSVENLPKILNHIQILFNYCLNIQEIPRKPSLDILCTQIIIRLGDLTYIFSYSLSILVIVSSLLSILKDHIYLGNQVSPHPLLCPKRLSVFSPRPLTSFGSPSNRFSFIEPDGSQMKKPTSSCGYFKRKVWNRGMRDCID